MPMMVVQLNHLHFSRQEELFVQSQVRESPGDSAHHFLQLAMMSTLALPKVHSVGECHAHSLAHYC